MTNLPPPPRCHYIELLAEAGFVDVRTAASPYGPDLEMAARVLGVDAVPSDAPERRSSPVLVITGTWPQE